MPASSSLTPATLPISPAPPPAATLARATLTRVRGKQLPSPAWTKAAEEWAASAALSDELIHGVGYLPRGSRTKCVHYTHGRSRALGHVQPDTLEREDLWKHLLQCYAEAYPELGSPTGSILLFGVVAEERYQDHIPGYSMTHKHAPCYTSQPHYWNKVADISRKKYNIYLNAVSHTSYATMFRYVRALSAKKPLSSLDARPFFSAGHPLGHKLQLLLEASDQSAFVNSHRRSEPKRERAPEIFQLVKDHRFKTATDLRAYACAEAEAGRSALAMWCIRRNAALQDRLDGAWSILDAPERVARAKQSRIDILTSASTSLACICGGKWKAGAEGVLERNAIPKADFCGAILRALQEGAVRGAHVACVGRVLQVDPP